MRGTADGGAAGGADGGAARPGSAARRERLDRELSPSTRARDAAATLAAYRARSQEALRTLDHRADLPYGPHPAERLHWFPPSAPPAPARRPGRPTDPEPGAPLLVFVHGGHWQESSKEDACFAAPALTAAGAGYVALGYGLAPGRSLAEMAGSVRRGLAWVRERAAALGGRADRVHAAGSSAGAHLVALATGGRDGVELAGVHLLSGLYDLWPVTGSYVNEALGLTPAEARRLSPLYRPPPRARHLLLARGQHETGEYARQQERYTAALRARGRRPLSLVAAGRDHFDLPLDLGDPATPLGRAVLHRLAPGRWGPAPTGPTGPATPTTRPGGPPTTRDGTRAPSREP
ncbi:alpha/beta hydrolase [Streptomyces zingiberis]|uniref:Alpha/beta hydrolase fold domain-containing protein n=1 Tax=Streptomyces zingiberis TaxID=2053010 RepID=A0ABX1C1N5_9ACTN|nr:alpha/beta hydrolase [Streptomyces zingiberis]NJQ03812.1 alpha/beta hydrolase fold domain-containing protein [Streptomyces zingiberis]